MFCTTTAGLPGTEMTGDQPAIDVVAATRSIADHEIDLLAAVEIGDFIRVRQRNRQHQYRYQGEDCRAAREHPPSR
jgi:hypothetical protein